MTVADHAAVDPNEPLGALAAAAGVGTSYTNWRGEHTAVSRETLRAVLAALDLPAASDRQARATLADLDHATVEPPSADRVPVAPSPAGHQWGWTAQVYQLRSVRSWGIGDLEDLRALATRAAATHGPDFVLANPLHAPVPTRPRPNSPYAPSSRRALDPLLVAPDTLPETAAASNATRLRSDGLLRAAAAANRGPRLQRDAAWAAKQEALDLLWQDGQRETEALAGFRDARSPDLLSFARYEALAERHGPDWRRWPAPLRDSASAEVTEAVGPLAERVDFHLWVQWLADRQLAGVQAAAHDAGMRTGVIADLAVGVDPAGADAWALGDQLARDVSIGAPPDAFNRSGQDWGLPPLRPDRLAVTDAAALRTTLRAVLARAGGVRIDHVLGLSRQWWVPAGAEPSEGTYVRFPLSLLLRAVVEEARAANAVVVGEDLGTVEPSLRTALADHGLLGCRVAWFERTEAGGFAPSAAYPERALATVTTHDLPTAAGWLTDAEVAAQHHAGLLGASDVAGERDRKAADRAALAERLRAENLIGAEPTTEQFVTALHAFVARSPARLVGAAIADAVGDPDQPNLPGTVDAYPNWRLPLAEAGPPHPGAMTGAPDAARRPVLLEELDEHPGVERIAKACAEGRRSADDASGD